jgi:hypothetical protein
MPHYKLLYPRDYVGACDLDKGDRTVTIASVKIEELHSADRGKKAEKKPVLFFKDATKKLVLNKTNAAIIAELYGTNTDKWIGKPITLYATTCSSFGKTTECVRVRPVAKPETIDENGEVQNG